MKHLKTLLAAVILGLGTSAHAIDRNALIQYASSLKGLKKEALKNELYNIMKQKSVLGYGSGMGCTWDGFWYTDRVASTNECINRYSSAKFYFTGHDGRSISGMNIEHSFPKSWWGGDKNDGYKDLFNLYPSDSKANNSKSNYAMGVVTEVTSQSGEGYDKVGYGDAGSRKHVRLWEPGDGFKGEFCRSYMYMATTYQYLNFTSEGLNQLENGDYPTLQQWSSDLFRQWNGQDRVDDVETARNDAVYELQHNRNLFIDYPYLCEYVWGDSMDVAFDPETSITTASDDSRYLQQVQPKVDKPVFTPAAGAYSEAQEVAITCSTPDAVIYYTLDGSEPTDADTRYTAAITVDKDMTIRAVAYVGSDKSVVATANYIIGGSPAGSFLFTKITAAPTAGKRYLIVADNGGQHIAAKPVNPSKGKSYGYLYGQEVSVSAASTITLADDVSAFTLEAAADGYYLKDSKGRYYYQDADYNTFTPTTDLAKADIWTVTVNDDATFSIKSSDTNHVIQYSPKYKSFAAYKEASADNIYPMLFEETAANGLDGIHTREAAPAAVYSLQGQRMPEGVRLSRGVYVRGGKKFVVK